MKQILVILAFLATLPLAAQDVWKEGTQWWVTYEDGTEGCYFLEGHTTFDGVGYINLKSVTTEDPDTCIIGYIRTERGDTVVYARFNLPYADDEEYVLYDFGSFEAGTCLRYSETDIDSWEVGLHTVTIDGDSLCYFHDVIEPGDILPCYNDIVFKVGHLGGPMFMVILEDETEKDPDGSIPPGPTRPNRKNISHTVLKLNDQEVTLSSGTMAQNDAEPLATIYQKFSFTLFDKVVELINDDESKNVILSPLSAMMALSMVQNGAANHTLAEIRQAMGTGGYINEQVNAYNQQLAGQLTYRPPFSYDDYAFWGTEEAAIEHYEADHPVCEMANGVWSKPHISLYDSFKEKLTTYYDAEVGQADIGTQEGVDFINGWVSEKTHQLIPSILDMPNPNIAVLLANALYFKGNWSSPFETYNTHTEKFHLADGNTTDVDMMQKAFYCHCVLTDKFSSATIPYGDGDFSMTIFLPTDAQGFPPLTFDDWWVVMDIKLGPTPINLHMPKFEIKGNYDLVEVFKSLGMEETFTPNADFSQTSNVPLWVDNIFQSGKIKVDEQGTEAAAVTAMVIPPGGEEFPDVSDFVIDRPFYFTIQHRPTNTILFVGRMMEIGKPTLSPDSIGNSNMDLSCPDDNHPHAIDLGLPSGTKWACCNVGSTTPEGYGGYYAWGETEEKEIYNWANYIHCDGSKETCHDIGSDIAGTEYDVAHIQWGDSWVMPSQDQIQELVNECSYSWVTKNGVRGAQFTGPGGGSIFLPETDIRWNEFLECVMPGGYYWSSTHSPYPGDAYRLNFDSWGGSCGGNDRGHGHTVRPVISGTSNVIHPKSYADENSQAVYNLYGIKVVDHASNMSTLPSGIYIINGKKIVIK